MDRPTGLLPFLDAVALVCEALAANPTAVPEPQPVSGSFATLAAAMRRPSEERLVKLHLRTGRLRALFFPQPPQVACVVPAEDWQDATFKHAFDHGGAFHLHQWGAVAFDAGEFAIWLADMVPPRPVAPGPEPGSGSPQKAHKHPSSPAVRKWLERFQQSGLDANGMPPAWGPMWQSNLTDLKASDPQLRKAKTAIRQDRPDLFLLHGEDGRRYQDRVAAWRAASGG